MNRESLLEIWGKYGSPLYIYDQGELEAHISRIRSIVDKKIKLCFAIKANPLMVSIIESLVDRLEVCSPGEMDICIHKHIPANKILMSGVAKAREDIITAIEYGVTNYTAESLTQMRYLDEVTKEKGFRIRVFCRLNTESQFGMSENDLIEIIKNKDKYEFCDIVGLHFFVGTQRKGKKQEKDIERICSFLNHINDAYDYLFDEIEYGPGLYVPYFEGEEEPNYDQLEQLNEGLQNLRNYKVTIEMGRYFVATCGYYLTSVVDTKSIADANYAIIDGGINHVNFYGSSMGLRIPRLEHYRVNEKCVDKGSTKEWTVCGSLCTTSDVIIRSVEMDDLQMGDLLVFKNVGAYSATESIALFLSRRLPKILIYNKETLSLERDSTKIYVLNMSK